MRLARAEETQPPRPRPRRRQRYVEAVSIVLLSCAGVATSWSSYQAADWSGVQAASYSRANALRLESARASAAADQLRAVDIAMFAAWIEAYARGDETLQQFYAERMRAEFAPAFDAWLKSRPRENPEAAATPFQLPEYRLAKNDEAAALAAQADAEFEDGQVANAAGGAYVLNAVLLASVMFMAGIVQQFRVFGVQMILLSAAAALLVKGLWNMWLYP